MKTTHQHQTGANGTYLSTQHTVPEPDDFHDSGLILVCNDGADIESTNYFDLAPARAGLLFLTWNASVARLLVPDSLAYAIPEMKTGKHCVISRGNWMGRDALEIMFDDDSRAPFSLKIEAHQCDRMVRPDPAPFELTAWTRAGKVGRWSANYRVVKKLPCLQPWK